MLYLIVVGATTTNAQNTHRFVIEVPFQFVVAGHTLAAGKYAVERVDPGRPNILLLKNTESGSVRLVMTQRVERNELSDNAGLVFIRRGEKYYLSQVWIVGDRNGRQVPSIPRINTGGRRDNPTFVRLEIKNESP
jgi:hypothetical protein